MNPDTPAPPPEPAGLVIEANEELRTAIVAHLSDRALPCEGVGDTDAATAWLRRRMPDVVVLAANVPGAENDTDSTLLPRVHAAAPDTPIIVLTAEPTVDDAVEAFHQGAWDFLPKPVSLTQLARLVRNALETTKLRRELQRHRAATAKGRRGTPLIAKSPAMQAVLDLAGRAAAHPSATVLLQGESGTGKSAVARELHDWSAVADGPFVTVACAAIPEQLLESELFGHLKGAFTGASTDRTGMAELASGGTLLLDEIGDMPPALQAKLLYLLETGRFRPVGAERERESSARIVAATNRDLEAAVQSGTFREDLYFRLKVVPIWVPPLRERREDIRLLAQHFLSAAARELDHSWIDVHPDALAAMDAYAWPGNLRELRNAMERAVVVGTPPQVQLADLPFEVRGEPPLPAEGAAAVPFVLPDEGVDLDVLERTLVQQALQRTGGNRSEAGVLLGMNRDAVRYRIRKYNIDVDAIQAARPDERPAGA